MGVSFSYLVLESLAQFCADPAAMIKDCPGVCANPAIAGTGSRLAAYAQAVIAGEYALVP